MAIIGAKKAYEDIWLEDPATNPDTPHWRIPMDDKSIDALMRKVGNAIDRAHALSQQEAGALTEDEATEAREQIVRLQKRVIVAFLGVEGYDEILRWLSSDDNPVDPKDHIIAIGDVFAALLLVLEDRATSKRLRKAGEILEREADKARKRPRKKGRR